MHTIFVQYAYAPWTLHLVETDASMKPLTLTALCGKKNTARARTGPYRIDKPQPGHRICEKCQANQDVGSPIDNLATDKL